MAPQSRSEVMKDATSNDEIMTGEASVENESINSLQEENERLREKLAATEEQLRLALLQKNTVQPPEDSTMSPTRRNKKWNYRDWISTNGSRGDHHELVSQEDSEDIVSVASIDVETQTVPVKEVQGLHHRRHHVENPSTLPRHHAAELEDATSALSRPFALKSKVSDAGISDMEKGGGGPQTPKSNASDESLLNDHHSLDDDCAVAVVRTGNIEDEPFCKNMADRCGWLVGLLVLQSCSSFILSNNQELLQAHIVIVQFLTMLVGAGGNCGNQASVRGM